MGSFNLNRAMPLSVVLAAMSAGSAWATNGHVLHGVGAVNQSMGGAGIATAIDATGSNFNNVGSISFLEKSSIEFGAELFMPERSYTASAYNGAVSGTLDSKTREAVIPSFALVYKTQTPWTFGFSAVGIGGFGVDYPADQANASGQFNPLGLPQSQNGFGSIYSNYQLLQLTPSVAYQINQDWSVGLGFNLDWASLSVDPWPATTPNASGYPSGSHSASAWGQGFTVGTLYKVLPNLSLGLSFKSPQWFNDFGWNSQYPNGAPAKYTFRLDYPLIVGAGLSYKPVEDLTLAADLKWINYRNTEGFQEKNFANAGSGPYVRGFGWEDIWAVSLGAQYKLNSRFTLRAGYNYSDNPIPSNQQFFNVFAPAIVQHHLTAGAGFNVTPALELNVAYYHAFENTQSGPFISNGGPGYPAINQAVPGTQITNRLSEDSVSAQVVYRFE
ncbi:OmpP1/FadL family transporter [Methylococcus sp. EFPC2]|uniref:OmpP1/FadL family transporter n=1 Tax=Methylococcus sp. EFPC2 TaxID=2812648 RepID=UPI0019684030|nr:outer membrane protein transport protein [Methylococcus sp. EFPC2]QSA95677.1 outer membrane protein transport protein [Methylococcus sp. EFPC2]